MVNGKECGGGGGVGCFGKVCDVKESIKRKGVVRMNLGLSCVVTATYAINKLIA